MFSAALQNNLPYSLPSRYSLFVSYYCRSMLISFSKELLSASSALLALVCLLNLNPVIISYRILPSFLVRDN